MASDAQGYITLMKEEKKDDKKEVKCCTYAAYADLNQHRKTLQVMKMPEDKKLVTSDKKLVTSDKKLVTIG